jgi:hypothetical protein
MTLFHLGETTLSKLVLQSLDLVLQGSIFVKNGLSSTSVLEPKITEEKDEEKP